MVSLIVSEILEPEVEKMQFYRKAVFLRQSPAQGRQGAVELNIVSTIFSTVFVLEDNHPKPVFKKLKRKPPGRWIKLTSTTSSASTSRDSLPTPGPSSCTDSPHIPSPSSCTDSPHTPSPSAPRVSVSTNQSSTDRKVTKTEEEYKIFDSTDMHDIAHIADFCKTECGVGNITTTLGKRSGWAVQVVITCVDCGYVSKFTNSPKVSVLYRTGGTKKYTTSIYA
ncbi:hypothetical protein HHI36_001647 [Cryptolaemus montrouzieri]|uniref:Uncharacterized protein n=1 Tax=Cryptolaemus montrouzieri TaxID=559131 RepID=A0ABD2P8X1_9CUCU